MSRKKVILGDLNANKFEWPLIDCSCSEKIPLFCTKNGFSYKKGGEIMLNPIKVTEKIVFCALIRVFGWTSHLKKASL